MDEITCCNYDDFVRTLADETRQSILVLLRSREMNVGEIVSHFNLSQPTISHHLRLLRWAGLVLARQEGKQVYYALNQRCLHDCCQLLVAQFTGVGGPARERS